MSINPFSLSLSLLTIVAASFAYSADESPERWAAEGKQAIQAALARKPIERKARNVILFIGDGMSIATVTASRIFEGQQRGESGEENRLSFESFPYTAFSKTYNTNQQTPDSAGTMSAIITGVKTKAGVLSVNQHVIRGDAESVAGNEVMTLLEKAEIAGKSTGIVTTARVTHATPAACYAHTSNRNRENDSQYPEQSSVPDIAAQLIEMPQRFREKGYPQVDGPEVVFGGGRSNFFPMGPISSEYTKEGDSGKRSDGRNLVQEWIESRVGGAYIHDYDTFEALDLRLKPKVLGLFESSHMQFEADRDKDVGGEPSLAEMTSKAIELLSQNEEGFLLVVEAGRIDHAHHAGNAYRALKDTVALSDAVRIARQSTSEADTLIVVTADHSHVLTMAGYPARGNDILGLVADADGKLAEDALGLPYTTLGYQNGPGYLGASSSQEEGAKVYPHSLEEAVGIVNGRSDLADLFDADDGFKAEVRFSHLQESAYPMQAETHGGEDVGVWASGPYAFLLHGTIEQNVIFHLMDFAFGLDE